MNLLIQLLPAISVILFGIVARNMKIFNQEHIKGFEIFLFKIGMPCYLFSVTFNANLNEIVNIPFIIAYLVTFVLAFISATLLHGKSPLNQKLSLSLASSYSNTSLYLTPILFFLFNNAIAGVIANLTQVIIIQSAMILILTFLNHKKASKLKIILKIIFTPLILIPILGIVANYFNMQSYLKYPYQSIEIIGKSATGMALFVFGLNCTSVKFLNRLEKITALKIVLIKNFIHPLIALFVGYFIIKLDGYWLKSLVIAASSPTAFLVYLISNQYNANDEAIKPAIILSSILSMLTIIFISFAL